ncbi:MAG: hypothetical protein V4724_14190 [Pseudomonadota bacterium]
MNTNVARKVQILLEMGCTPVRRIYLFAAACVCLWLTAMSAQATTETENKMYHDPMPHALLGTGNATVTVHKKRLEGYWTVSSINASELAELKALTGKCIQDHQKNGVPINPPKTWPDFLHGARTDDYDAINRSIHYSRTQLYDLDLRDCSLMETKSFTASLSSSLGICSIDLIEKTAHGFCDATAHGNAPTPRRRSLLDKAKIDDIEKRWPASPGAAALVATMRQILANKTGDRKTILGFECDMWKDPINVNGMTCLYTGGSFRGRHAPEGTSLEMTSEYGINMHAIEAVFDTQVNAAVFAPYMAGGFTINNLGPQKNENKFTPAP